VPDALFLLAALAANIAGLGWLALAMDVHWQQVRGGATPPSTGVVKLLRLLGVLGLLASLLMCLRVDHISMASLVWVMGLAAAALAVAFALAWRPRWLAPLLCWVPQAPAA
jgi:Protein of unknown function (DUF3325)